jgi:hypothetical protein
MIGETRHSHWLMTSSLGVAGGLQSSRVLEGMSLLAGASVGQAKRLMSAASIIHEMINDAEAVIRRRLGSMALD